MIKVTSISWQLFLIGVVTLLLVWLFTSRTKIGRSFILNYSIWSLEQWVRVLLVIAVTLFILVNPIFHILTAAVLVSFYYLFVGQKLTPINKTRDWDISDGIPLFDREQLTPQSLITFTCKPINSKSLILDRVALNRCLFSFPYISSDTAPEVKFLNETYEVNLQLDDEKYTASLHSYIQNAGYSITSNLSN